MNNKGITALKSLLIVLITSISITGISFLDDKIWNIIIAVIGVSAYGIVGLLYSIHLIDGKQEGKTAYAAVVIILIIIGFLIYQGIIMVEQWILSWPIAVKIIVPTIMGLLIVGTTILLVIEKKKKTNIRKQEEKL
ncbi:MAG: hypothetical protein WAP07_00920 [Acutalibacteraceae bacterium]|jgi:hypothetical protein